MSKLEELKQYVSQLFEAATDKDVIQKAAVVSTKIDEIAAEQKTASDDYNKLLKDYKDVIIHSSFKPLNSGDKGADIPLASFDANKTFEEAIKSAINQSKGDKN